MAKKKTLKYWKTKIDKPFQDYTRRSDVNNEGYGACISSDYGSHCTESGAAHLIAKGACATTWEGDKGNNKCRTGNRSTDGRHKEKP